MEKKDTSAQSFLEAAYKNLHFDEGDLLSTKDAPTKLSATQWVEKGEWLSLAEQVGAEKIFFVNNNPVVIFAESSTSDIEALRLFNRVWCMARPLLLFVARDGELAVYSLARPPVKTVAEWRTISPLDVVKTVADVSSALHDYRREQVESGRLFEEKHFGDADDRADQSLIRDLRIVRDQLKENGLSGKELKYAHALIGRSIFIRYLEDREVLDRKYFERVAANNPEWLNILNSPLPRPVASPEMETALYSRVLSNWEFTYTLFDRLAEDFNGDMFPSDINERRVVTPQHLSLLQGFLRGDVGPQSNLFFWAYRFDIIPVELISSIYEEFYHVEKNESNSSDLKGTHYTRSTLVEFILSQVLTIERLETNPRILDPACGSGIFLVEAFRRIVRFHVHRRGGERLSASELRGILRTQIAGIEINEEAIMVAAFSLYLALLHYQKPKAILRQIEQGNHLPSLKYQAEQPSDETHFNNLLNTDTFRVRLNSTKESGQFPFMDESTYPAFIDEPVDIIVGNPPWGTTDVRDYAIEWCNKRRLPVGDEELSQAFIWKSLDLLRQGGVAGLLVSTGVFFKHQSNSVEFRKRWLQSCRLVEVVNFAHVRDVFFPAGIAPFASIIFQKSSIESVNSSNNMVRYWSAKKTTQINFLQTVILNQSDLKVVSQGDLRRDDKLWKIYWWGNDRDRALINWLESNTTLGAISDNTGYRLISGRGFQKRGGKLVKSESGRVVKEDMVPAEWLKQFKWLPTTHFSRYGLLDKNKLCQIPEKVHRRGVKEVYEGERLLIKRGISQGTSVKGQIIARLESEPYSFLNSIHGIKLRDAQTWEYKVILGIFWSSLSRYYYFLTSSAWGMWHYELHLEEIERMPIRFPDSRTLRNRIVKIVDDLRTLPPSRHSSHKSKRKAPKLAPDGVATLERQLDEVIFDLYELSEPERDQIRDMCDVGIEFFYNSYKSEAVKPVRELSVNKGLFRDLTIKEESTELENYLETFLQIWNSELTKSNGEFGWRVIQPQDEWPLIAVVFSSYSKGDIFRNAVVSDQQQWFEVLHKLSSNFLTPYNSNRVFIDGLVRAVTDTDIIIIKRNERRLWTRSMAREDAEAILVQVLNLQEATRGA
jgi:hypothetical protein